MKEENDKRIEEIEKHILRKYDVLDKLGKYEHLVFHFLNYFARGAYGIVWKAISRKNQQVVALKKCFDAFQSPTDAQRTYREIMFLKELHGHENIVQLQSIFESEASEKMDIYIVFDFMESDLHAVIKMNLLQDVHKQYVLYQILKALKFIHSGGLIHRDMKPSNVLLNGDCHVKLCDFGLARSVVSSPSSSSAAFDLNPVMTEYVATRWYRAPELLLGSTTYTRGVDIWAVGCILAEMIGGKAIFPGSSTLDQLERVLAATGRPSAEDADSLNSREACQLIDSVHISRRSPFYSLLPQASEEATDLIRRSFQFNPKKRPEAHELLSHPYLSEFHDPSRETSCHRTITIPVDDNVRLTIDDYRRKLSEEISKMEDGKRPSALTTPPKTSVPPSVVSKEYSNPNRSSNIPTPTTCHTGHRQQPTITTPQAPTPKQKGIYRSPSSQTILLQCRNPPTAPAQRTPKVVVGSKVRVVSSSASRPATPAQRAPIIQQRPGSTGTRILSRTPSVGTLLSRGRVATPASVGKRPSSGFYR